TVGAREEAERERSGGGRRVLRLGRREPRALDELVGLERLMLLRGQPRVERERAAPGAPQVAGDVRRRDGEVAEQRLHAGAQEIAPGRGLETRRRDVAAALVPHDRQAQAQRGGPLKLAELAQQVGGAQDRALAVAELAEPPLEETLAQRVLGRDQRRGA